MLNNREYELPYNKTLRGTTQIWEKEFIDSYCGQMAKLLEFDGFKIVSQIQMGGGSYFSNDPQSKLTSISHRNIVIGMSFDIFYDVQQNENAEQDAINFQNECEKLWIQNGLFSPNKEDIRFTWGTFGDTNIEHVWQYYYDDEGKYNKLREIKGKVDPTNLFQNRFTIPPASK